MLSYLGTNIRNSLQNVFDGEIVEDRVRFHELLDFRFGCDRPNNRPKPGDYVLRRRESHSVRGAGYSAGSTRPPAGGATWPLAASFSYQMRWCSLAQFSSTVPSHIASMAPSMPMVPM